jgi:hypothetical protein
MLPSHHLTVFSAACSGLTKRIKPADIHAMNVNASSPYPRWERQGTVSRFLLEPERSVYEIEEMELIGGSIFVAFASETTDLVGQFESEQNAKQACARDFTKRQMAGHASAPKGR